MFDDFKKDYYGIDSLVGETQVNVAAYKSLFPIIVFDVRKQNEKIKTGVTDIQVKFEFNAAVPADTTAYAIMISDRFYKLVFDGNNMSVVHLYMSYKIIYQVIKKRCYTVSNVKIKLKLLALRELCLKTIDLC